VNIHFLLRIKQQLLAWLKKTFDMEVLICLAGMVSLVPWIPFIYAMVEITPWWELLMTMDVFT